MHHDDGTTFTDHKREPWAEQNAAASAATPFADVVEHYPAGDPQDGATLAQRLHDEGLVFAINREILHPLGLALGVGIDPATSEAQAKRGRVKSLTLYAAADEPIVYEGAIIERNVAKLRAAGHDALADQVTRER